MIDSSNSRAAVQKSIKTHRTIHPEQPKCEIYKTLSPARVPDNWRMKGRSLDQILSAKRDYQEKNNGSRAALENRG